MQTEVLVNTVRDLTASTFWALFHVSVQRLDSKPRSADKVDAICIVTSAVTAWLILLLKPSRCFVLVA